MQRLGGEDESRGAAESPGRGSRVDWRAVAVFYGLACLISWPMFWWRDRRPESWARSEVPGIVKALAPGLGPAVGALVAWVVFRKSVRRTVSLVGTSPARSLAFAGVTVGGLALVGVGDDEPHLTGLLWGVVYVLYALGEEAGWRGFLQDALRPLPEARRYLVVGLMWGTWHFTTFASGPPTSFLPRLGLMYVMWFFASWGMGRAVDQTRSLTVAAMLHLVFNIATGFPRGTGLPALVASIVVWVVLLRTWKPAGPVEPVATGGPA